jgi:CO dehydrogenase maturation factor
MKIAISGKGGVGKTTFASFLIKALVDEGKKVLAIDADPDANLAQALGVENSDEIVPISEMKALIEERTEAKTGGMGSLGVSRRAGQDAFALKASCSSILCGILF